MPEKIISPVLVIMAIRITPAVTGDILAAGGTPIIFAFGVN